MARLWTWFGGALIVSLSAAPAAALSYEWPWAEKYTDVSLANRTFAHRPPSTETGQKSAHELSARRNRGDDSRGVAAAAVRSSFDPVFAQRVRVTFFGRVAETENDPTARLKVYVHCVGETDTEWVLVGGKSVDASTASQTLSRAITVEDCETQTENGVMLQVTTGERGDRKRRTVFLERAELGELGAPVWVEDFTVS